MAKTDPRQPPWSPTGEQTPDSVTYKGEECGQREVRQQRAVVVEGGDAVIVVDTQALPHLPYLNMLDPAGNVCAVAISNNRVARQPSASYKAGILSHWRKKGWILWDFVPPGSETIEPQQFGLTPEQWEAKRDGIKADRQSRTSAASAVYQVKADDKKGQELLGKALENNSEVLGELLEHLKRQQPGGKRAKGDASAE